MRTKTLVCAAVLAASIATTMAQSNVYSLNVVGYYNITIGAGQKVMIANQLNTTNNTIGSLLANALDNDLLYKYAGGFNGQQYSAGDGAWEPDPTVTLNPGEAAFYIASGAETITFVGEVLQGSLTNTLPLGVKVMRSSIVPQQGMITADLGVPPDDNDIIYTFSGGYNGNQYSLGDGQWEPIEPTINVGQGFFYIKADALHGGTAANTNWIRNFTVQ